MTSRTSTFVALLLLALWLPATQHCGLEAVGVLPAQDDCYASAHLADHHDTVFCDVDNCQSVDDEIYKSKLTQVQLAAPIAVTCLYSLKVIAPVTIIVSLISPTQTDAPPELAPSWQFTTRAAPAPRAPGILA